MSTATGLVRLGTHAEPKSIMITGATNRSIPYLPSLSTNDTHEALSGYRRVPKHRGMYDTPESTRLTRELLLAEYHTYGKPKADWLVGGEFERHLLRADGTPVPYFGEHGVAWLLEQEEATLKHFFNEGERIRLQPANDQMQPIFVSADKVEVRGRVVGVLRMMA